VAVGPPSLGFAQQFAVVGGERHQRLLEEATLLERVETAPEPFAGRAGPPVVPVVERRPVAGVLLEEGPGGIELVVEEVVGCVGPDVVDDDREGRLGVLDAQLSVHREDPVGRLLTGIVDVDPAGSGVGSRVDVSAQQPGRFGQRVVEPPDAVVGGIPTGQHRRERTAGVRAGCDGPGRHSAFGDPLRKRVEPEAVGDEDDDVADRLPVGAGSET